MAEPKWKLTHLHSSSGRIPVMWWGECEIELYQATPNDMQRAAGRAHQWQVNYHVEVDGYEGKTPTIATATAVFDTYREAKDFADEWAALLMERREGQRDG